jgi:hypothetical protein
MCMTIREFMEENINVACINIQSLIIGLDEEGEPFYYHEGEGPFVFGLSYNALLEKIQEEIRPENITEKRIPLVWPVK